MKKIAATAAALLLTAALSAPSAAAAGLTHKVSPGDTMWKLAVQYQDRKSVV